MKFLPNAFSIEERGLTHRTGVFLDRLQGAAEMMMWKAYAFVSSQGDGHRL